MNHKHKGLFVDVMLLTYLHFNACLIVFELEICTPVLKNQAKDTPLAVCLVLAMVISGFTI
jgi:hypothetical protein